MRKEQNMKAEILITALFLITTLAHAKVDLVTLPTRDSVQLTIYNSGDLTLARENRALTLMNGNNRLQFSWANTLIDPTSLDMIPMAKAADIDIQDLVYPPRVRNLGVWNIVSRVSGKVPMEITYFTSGLSWRAFYMGTLSPDEKTMQLEGYVRVTNNSGEDYENAQTRLIVGKVNLLDRIAELARRRYPYGRPGVKMLERTGAVSDAPAELEVLEEDLSVSYEYARGAGFDKKLSGKKIVKEGLSEYFLYTIEGTETIPNGWSKRLPSFEAEGILVTNLYKFELERYGKSVVRFLSFINDKEHKLGETPIPGGLLKVYRTADQEQHLAYEGQSNFKYIPVDEDVELNLGVVQNVIVEPKLMEIKSQNYDFDWKGNITGWEEKKTWKIEVKNTRKLPVRLEIKRNIPVTKWDIENKGDCGVYEKEDMDTVKYTLDLQPESKKEFEYVVTMYFGTRAE
jgi:hypothetical protein